MPLMPSRDLVRRFIEFVILQGISKVLGLVQGLLVIHLISKWDYGLYALLLAVVMATANIAVCGVGMFISSVGGRHVNDPERMASIYAAGRTVQNRLVAIGLVIVAVAMPIQCHVMQLGTPITIACLTSFALLMMILHARSTLCRELLMISLNLRRQQMIELSATSTRLGLIGLLYACDLLNVVTLLAIALVVSALTVTVQDYLVHRLVLQGRPSELRPEDLKEANRVVLPQLPNAAYNSVQDQVPYLLMSWIGSIQHVAEYAAIGRLGIMFSFLFDVLGDFFMPRIGRCQDPRHLAHMIFAILSGYYALVLSALLIAYFFRADLVWLLGRQYANLEGDIPLMLTLIGVGAVSGSLFLINSARAWLRHSWLFIISTITSQAVFIPLLDLHTIHGMLTFSIVPHIAFIIINAVFLTLGLRRAHHDH